MGLPYNGNLRQVYSIARLLFLYITLAFQVHTIFIYFLGNIVVNKIDGIYSIFI